MSRATLHLEIIERHRYEIRDPEVAAQIRQALEADDIERLSELIDFLNITGPQETSVLEVQPIKSGRRGQKRVA